MRHLCPDPPALSAGRDDEPEEIAHVWWYTCAATAGRAAPYTFTEPTTRAEAEADLTRALVGIGEDVTDFSCWPFRPAEDIIDRRLLRRRTPT